MNQPGHLTQVDFPLNGDAMTIGAFAFGDSGMVVHGQPTFEDWANAMHALQTINRRIVQPFPWWLGDAIRYGEQRFGEMYVQAIEDTGLEYQTLANIKYVAANVPPENRQLELSFSTHAEVAALPAQEQRLYLAQVKEEGLSVAHLRHRIRRDKGLPCPELTCPKCGAAFAVSRSVKVLEA